MAHRFQEQLALAAQRSTLNTPISASYILSRSVPLSMHPSPFHAFHSHLSTLCNNVLNDRRFLTNIFSHLHQPRDFYTIMGVSRLWRDCVCDGIHSLDFRRYSERVTDRPLVACLQRIRHLQRLTLDNCTQLNDCSLSAFAPLCPKLTAVSFLGCAGITDQGVSDLIRHTRIIHLNLERCSITDTALLELSYCAPSIRTLSLAQTTVGDTVMGVMLMRLLHLEELDLRGCLRLTDQTLRTLGAARLSAMRRLDLSNCPAFTGPALRAAVPALPALRTLRVIGCYQVDADSVFGLLRSCPRLAELDVSWCDQWSPQVRGCFLGEFAGRVRVQEGEQRPAEVLLAPRPAGRW
ncbi:hypothetical protein PAPYR_4177 [Paratrimastix pyriformis]|uniref:F-box/LRR-repeat protein 15-like leucin rich repeat domain-containing protein n=1 Tax=Paratrimastix pyriformis TaxID=342808 RepID=A0ABQ8UP24_9EUKA|nr:hypothetical protein PAPYR_4177 [Paratrimastix pyriformis]